MRFLKLAAAKMMMMVMLFGIQANASSKKCSVLAGKAAISIAKPQGVKRNSPLIVDVANVQLLESAGGYLKYNVEISFEVADGYSDSFPSENYIVIANGNEVSCKILSVKLNSPSGK